MVRLVRMVYTFGQNIKLGQNGKVHLGLNVTSSAHNWDLWSMVVTLAYGSNTYD